MKTSLDLNAIKNSYNNAANARKSEAQKFLEKQGREFDKNGNTVVDLTIQTNNGNKSLGKVSYSAYKAIEGNALDSYKPKNNEEKSILDKYRMETGAELTKDDGTSLGFVTKEGLKAISEDNIKNYQPINADEKKAIDSYVAYATQKRNQKLEEYKTTAQKKVTDIEKEKSKVAEDAATLRREKAAAKRSTGLSTSETKWETKDTRTAKEKREGKPIPKSEGETELKKLVNEYRNLDEEADAMVETIANIDKYANIKYNDKGIVGQTQANYTQGRLSQDTAQAYNEYVGSPTEANRMRADALSAVSEQFQINNKNALTSDDEDIGKVKETVRNWVGVSLANYLPQFIDQTKASIKGAVGGATAGAVVGSALPGVGTAVGAVKGAKTGWVLGSSSQMYQTTRGMVFKSLIDAGYDEETAIKAANDEAFVSSIIEGAGEIVSMTTLGTGKLFGKLAPNAATKVSSNVVAKGVKGFVAKTGKKISENAVLNATVKVAGVVANAFGEYAEEYSQEAVSIANERRLKNPNASGKLNLASETISLLNNMDDETKARLEAAGTEGFRIGLMMGGGTVIGNKAGTSATDHISNAITGGKIKKADANTSGLVQSVIDIGLQQSENSKANKLATKLSESDKISSPKLGKLSKAIKGDAVNVGETYYDTKSKGFVNIVSRDDTTTTVILVNSDGIGIEKEFSNEAADNIVKNNRYVMVANDTQTEVEQTTPTTETTETPTVEETSPIEETTVVAENIPTDDGFDDYESEADELLATDMSEDTEPVVVEQETPAETIVAENETTPTKTEISAVVSDDVSDIGNIYNIYGEDAELISEKLGLKSTPVVVNGKTVSHIGLSPDAFDVVSKELKKQGITIKPDKPVTNTQTTTTETKNEVVTEENATNDKELSEAFVRGENGEIRFNQTDIDYNNNSMRKGQFKIVSSLTKDAVPETVDGWLCGKYGIHKSSKSNKQNVVLLTLGMKIKSFDTLTEAKKYATYLNENLSFNDVTYKQGLSGDFYVNKTDELMKYVADTNDIFDNKTYETTTSTATEIENGKVPFNTKAELISYVKSHIGDKVKATFNNGNSEVRTLHAISNTSLRTKRPDGSVVTSELKGVKYNDNGIHIDFKNGVEVTFDFVNVTDNAETETVKKISEEKPTPQTVKADTTETKPDIDTKDAEEVLKNQSESDTIKENNVKESAEDVHERVLDRESGNDSTVRESEPVQEVEEKRNVGTEDRKSGEDVASENGRNIQSVETETSTEEQHSGRVSDNGIRESDNSDGDSGIGVSGNDNVNDEITNDTETEKESKAKDYSITKAVAEELDTKSPSIDDNIQAIETLHELEKSGKAPTKAQQSILAKFKGWGGLSNAFWSARNRLKEIMSDSEISAAQSTVNDAYFTPTTIIDSIYKGLSHLGFEGGNILEPSMGVGNFFGKMPKSIKDVSSLFGVEIDSISGRIAQYLYPSANIEVAPFQDVAYKDNSFDLIIGNVPFGEVKYKYKNNKYLIHDYFFVKAMDKLNDGGIMVFLTSKGTLDKLDSTTRAELNRQGNIIGAYRLPSNVFSRSAGANVVTDLIIMQKTTNKNGEKFVNTGSVKLGNENFSINEYFVNHPENIIGELTYRRGQYGKYELTVQSTGDVAEQLIKAIRKLPKNLLSGVQTVGTTSVMETTSKLQTFYINDKGNVEYVDAQTGEVKELKNTVKSKNNDIAKEYLAIKKAYTDLTDFTLNEAETSTIESKRKELNTLYDGFVKKYGTLEKNKKLLSADNDFYKLSGLEVYDTKTKKIIKSEMFSKDTIGKRKPKKADNVLDALSISMGESGTVNLKRISELTNLPIKEVAEQLSDRIIYTPDGNYELNEVYLSGNVREKYEAVKGKKGFEKNEQMLKAVIPEDIPAKDIVPQFGASWIDPKYVAEFLRDTFQLRSTPKVVYDATTGTWSITSSWGDHTLLTNKYGTKHLDGIQLSEKALNMRQIVVKNKDGVILGTETKAAQQKALDIKNAFEEWCFKDADRRNDLVETFNRLFNSNRNMDFSELAKYLTFNGLSDTFQLRDYQKRAVARGIFNGNTLLAHGVGTGKTAEMITIAMELKRMGMAKKNMMVVPPHKVADFRNDILKMYPSAKVAMLEKGANATQRQRFYAQVAANDFDIVIIPHSSFGLLDVSKDTKIAFINNQISELEEVLTAAQLEKGSIDGRFIRQLENQKKRLEEKLKFITESKKDNGNTFEELGVDSLFVDEAHNFKNLPFYTKLSRVAGVSAPQNNNKDRASRAENMFMITDYLNRNNGRITFGTATPITKSMSEIYNMTRFLRPDILRDSGLQSFDAWAAMFGSIVNKAETKPSGRGMRMKERFSKFRNVSQMIEQFRRFADILKSGEVIEDLPVAERINVINPSNEIQEEFLDRLDEIISDIQTNGARSEYNMLQVTKAGEMAALDLRMVVSYFDGKYTLDDLNLPNNRTSQVAERVYKEYTDSNATKGTQFVFCDAGVYDNPDGTYGFHVYGDLINKLVAYGIPRSEIAVAQEFEDKADLSAKVNTGEIRVLIGSTAVMGEGMNAQNKAVALHHMTIPDNPAGLEQREGRIIRYGNENKNVRIYRYIQESSYDSYKWQMQERKADIINQALSGGTVEELEEMSDFQLSAREAKAIASGNPLLLEKIEVEDKITNLKMLRKKFNTDKLEMQERLNTLPNRIRVKEKIIENGKADLKTIEANKTNDFEITLGKIKYTERAKAAEALERGLNKAPKNGTVVTIGKYRGLELKYSSSIAKGTEFILEGVGKYTVMGGDSALGNITRIMNAVEKISENLSNDEALVNKYKSEIITLEKEVQSEFAQAKELAELETKLSEIDTALGINVSEVDMSDVFVDDDSDDGETVQYSLESEEDYEQEGNLLHNDSEQWYAREYPGEQVAGLAKATERGIETAKERKAYTARLNSNQLDEKVITDKDGNKHRYFEIKPSAWNGHMNKIADYYAQKGVNVHFIKGSVQIAFVGDEKTANAMRTGNDIYISYDNTFYTPEQLSMHEYIHIKFDSPEFQKIVQDIIEALPKREYNQLVEKVKKAYGDIIENPYDYEQELICDILSGMTPSSLLKSGDIVLKFWIKESADILGYDISQYAESTDAGGVYNEYWQFSEDVVDEGYSTEGTKWAIVNGLLTRNEQARFWECIAELSKRKYRSIPKSKNGQYIIDVGQKLIFTNGDFKRTTINAIIEFNGEYEANINEYKEWIIDEERNTAQHRESIQIIEIVQGEGYVSEHLPSTYRTDERENGRRKRTNSEQSYSIDGKTDINYSLDTETLTPERKKEILEQYERDRVGVEKPTQKQLWGERAEWIAHNMSRVFPNIPERGERGTFFAEFRKNMIQWNGLSSTADFMVKDKLNEMTKGLTPAEFKTFGELVYFLDLQEEAQIQKDRGYDEILLPNEITPDEVDAIVEMINEEATENVKKALDNRQKIWNDLKEQYIALNQHIGFNTDEKFKRKNYYHHQVIEYMNGESKGTGSRAINIKAGRGWLKERQGSTKAINTDFLAVEHKAMLQMQYDIYVAQMLGKIKDKYDIKPQLEKQAFNNNKKQLNDIIKKEATDDEGNIMFDSKGKPDSETYREQQAYNRSIMRGFNGLFELAEADMLPTFNGQYGNAIRALKKHNLNAPGLYNYVAQLASMELNDNATNEEHQAQISARTVLKYTSQKKAWVKQVLGNNYQTWETIAKSMSDTHTIHQPRRGNYFYTKEVLNEDAFNQAFNDMIVGLVAGENGIDTTSDVKKLFEQYSETVRQIGAAYEQWVIPNEIVTTMQEVANPKALNEGQKVARAIMTTWKGAATSTGVLRTVKFGLRNMAGDLDAVIAGNPKILMYSKQAVEEIYQAMRHKKYTDDFIEFVERGGYSSMLWANEMDTEMQEKFFSHLMEKTAVKGKNILEIPANIQKKYKNGVETAHNFREAILRYSAYLYYKEAIKRNSGNVKDYVASNRYIVRGLESVEDKAYQLAKDLLGAYDEVGKMGQTLRRYWIPFYSFTETNLKRYYRLFENIIMSDDSIPKKAGKLLLKTLMVNLFGLLLIAWNRLAKKDDDDKLPTSARNVPHLTLGTIGGNVYAFRQLGSFSEILEWFGLEDYKWESADEPFKEMVNKAYGMINPGFKYLYELPSGMNSYPDVFKPSPIRDRLEYLANSWGVAEFYNLLSGKPTKGIGEIVKGAFIYSYDINESAYNEIRTLKYAYQGKDDGTTYKPNKKSNALYYMKKAVKYKDKETALKYLDEYFENGGTAKGITQSFSTLNPMYGFTGKDTIQKGEAFIATLTPEEKEKLKMAQDYYEKELMLPENVSKLLGKKDMTEERAKNLLKEYINSQCK